MKRIATLLAGAWLCLGLAAGIATGCGKVAEPDQLGGETHWLRRCSAPGDCGSLECWCGVCTAACDSDSTCGAIVEDARCLGRVATPFAADCGAATPPRLCAEAPLEPSAAPGGSAPLGCQGPDVVVLGECLACDAARSRIDEQLQSLLDNNGWNSCQSDVDCVAQEWSTACDGQCNVSISSTAVDEFEAAIGGFSTAVCDPALWRPSCGNPRNVDCNTAPLCIDGVCRIGPLACADRTLEACESDGACTLSRAARYLPDAQCYTFGNSPVGCVDPDVSCPPVITPAVDGEGNCFAFGGCLPPGFTRLPSDHPCNRALGTVCAS